MALLNDVRGLFRRRSRPVGIDLTGTQAESLAASLHSLEAATSPAASPGSAAAEIMDLLRRVGVHLDEQGERQQQLLQLMERLPPALDALPETARLSASVLEDVHAHILRGASREDGLRDAIARMQETAARQTEVLGLVHSGLDGGAGTLRRVEESLNELGRALTAVAESNIRTAAAVADASRAGAEREMHLAAALRRTQLWSILAVVFCGAAVVVAAVAMIALR